MDKLALGTRARLPDPLRVLAEKHPRLTWEAHPEFSALTRFWLDRHLGFRRLQTALIAETEGFLGKKVDPRRYGGTLARLAGHFINELHGHHHIEDDQYFPLLTLQDQRLTAGFDLLDRDHKSIDPKLDSLAKHTNAVLADLRAKTPDLRLTDRLRREFTGFQRLLDRHLIDEEELVVPVILEYHPRELG